MSCICCKGKTLNPKDKVCPNCEDALGLLEAQETARDISAYLDHYDNAYWRQALPGVAKIARRIESNSTLPLIEKAERFAQIMERQIKKRLLFYNQRELIILTLLIKEHCHIRLLHRENGAEPWHMGDELEMALMIQKLVLTSGAQEFKGNPLELNYRFLQQAVTFARILVMLKTNIERYHYQPAAESLMEMATRLIEDESLKKYFDMIGEYVGGEKPEDFKISNSALQAILSERGITPEKIQANVSDTIEDLFGFHLTDLNVFIQLLLKFERKKYPLIIIRKDILMGLSPKKLPQTRISGILEALSLNELVKKPQFNERHLELRSLYEVDGYLIFGSLDLIQTGFMFEKLVLSNHFPEMYFPKGEKLNQLQKAQEKLSTFFAYYIAEQLDKNGYPVPTHKAPPSFGQERIVRAEIETIPGDSGNILEDAGDIDVLALNPYQTEIIIIEMKYYKPAFSIRELVLKDSSRIRDKDVIRKITRRENIVKEHLTTVIKFLNGDPELNYRVRSILVTVRPNFYGIDKNLGVEYMSIKELIDKIGSKTL